MKQIIKFGIAVVMFAFAGTVQLRQLQPLQMLLL